MKHTTDSLTNSLGQYLRHIRSTRGLEMEEISKDTCISMTNLKAMEADDFSRLPADVFARGLYALYAKALGLNSEEIIAWYNRVRNINTSEEELQQQSFDTSGFSSNKVHSYAEAPGIRPITTLLIFVFMLISITCGVFWYFHINPIALIKEKIHLIKTKTPDTAAVAKASARTAAIKEKNSKKETSSQEETASAVTESHAGEANAAVQHAEPAPPPAPPPPAPPKHLLKAEFIEVTRITTKIDKEKPATAVFQAGSSHEWSADEKIVLSMYGRANVRLTFDGVPVEFPKKDGRISISMPVN